MSRRPLLSLAAVSSIVILGFFFWIFTPSPASVVQAQGVSQAQGPRLVEAGISVEKPQPVPEATLSPDSLVHTVGKGESLPSVVRRYLPSTPYMKGAELEAALRAANPGLKGLWLKPGQQLIVPNYHPTPWIEKSVLRPRDFEVRAIYLTGIMAGSANGQNIVKRWKEVGGNAV